MTTTIDPTRELTITRTFDAPKDMILHLWSDPEMLARWWGPIGFTTTTLDMDFRPGGKWSYRMDGPNGQTAAHTEHFIETGPDRITYEQNGTGEDADFRATITLEAISATKTQMEFRMTFKSAEIMKMMKQNYKADVGHMECFTRLDMFAADELAHKDPFKMHLSLPSDTEIRTVRSLRAPKELVFEAFVNPDYIAKWQGPRDIQCTGCTFDARVGGKWSMTHARGEESFSFHGEVLEYDRPDRLVGTFQFMDFDPMTNTTTFEETNGVTKVTTVSSFTSKENRDGMLYSGIEGGMTEGYERLQEKIDSGDFTV